MMRGQSVYRALLRCYPAAFRDEYGGQMLLTFAEQMGEARRNGGLRERAALWLHAAADAFTIAPQEHWNVIYQDIRFALRGMKAHPGFTAVAILSLTLGIGANTAIFSLWNGVLHSALPAVQHPEQLLILSNPENAGMWHGSSRGEREWLTFTEFEQLHDRATSFSAMMASQSFLETWQLRFQGSNWEQAHGRLVSGSYFPTLGVSPALGRGFTAASDRSPVPEAIISHSYWQRRFGGTPDVLGRTFSLRNATLTIVGVAPPGFAGESAGQQPDLWIPIGMQPAVLPGEDWLHDSPPEKVMWLHVFARLKPGVTAARAEAEANAIFKAGLEQFYGAVSLDRRPEFMDQRLKIHPGGHGASTARGDFSTSLTVLLAAVGLLLLIACANLANLLLARSGARRPEIALRISLGASRGRLVRQLVTESLLLAAMGGAAGLAAAWLVHSALVRIIIESARDFQMAFTLDPMVLAFTIAVTLTAGLLFGLLPAWQTTRAGIAGALNEQGRGGGGGVRMRWGRSIVSLQLALSLPLLVGAGLLARSLYNLQHIDLGYPIDRLVMAGIDSRVAGYNSLRSTALFADLLARVQHIPGVQAASVSHNGVFTGSNSGDPVEVEGYTSKSKDDRSSSWDMVGPGYFSTLGIPVLLGREILDSDRAGGPKVCVINQSFARKFFEGRNPVGMHLTAIDESSTGVHRTVYEIVGVARDARTNSLRADPAPRYYMPFTQPHGDNVKRASFLIRTAAEHTPVLGAVREAFRQVDPSLPIDYARSIQEQMTPWTASNRATADVAVVFGCIALALAAIGLYGVLSYGISRRKSEFAIRMALGARPAAMVAMVLRETSALIVAGLVVGGGLTYAASRWIASQLFGVAPQDPLTLAAAVGILLMVALAAVYLPARRASRQDPILALRHE